MKFWQRVVVDAIIFIALAGFYRNSGSFVVTSVWVAIGASLVLAVLNASVKPFLQLISLPITILTLGLFSIVINAVILQLTSFLVGPASFYFSSFGMTMWIALLMSILNAIISNYFINR
ncbi:phage holin family protein [Pediococcus ethanolidurans]|nr:phage holin family protein [Pediococcus ethanolidurans]MBU7555320.1 phage holin family protein [Pediococcus ethanolidurans]MBU7562796.1 phage holin family protein [Pediococcus ethanolidurans]MCT4397991.1 phage holin family protein [Pediococcus ethanolidurans]MCV3314755.1 phage holin family protein [Pediococcus ethanolidurans]MCV3321052.1 phage holin family protein [Pediococcus ethanolidurans]